MHTEPYDRDQLREALWDELTLVRAAYGWRKSDLAKTPRLMDMAEAEHGERTRAALHTFLLDRLDPPGVDGKRTPLTDRSRMDAGLMMRWLFGEPDELDLRKAGGATYRPHIASVSARLVDLETFRSIEKGKNHTGQVIFRQRRGNTPGGPARERLHEIVEEMLDHPVWAAASTEETESRQPDQHDGPSDEVPTALAPKRTGLRVLGCFSRKRVAAAVVVSVVALSALAFAVIDREASSGPPGLTQHADLTIGSNKLLATGLLVQNKSLKSGWHSRVRADPRDDVSLAVTIQNRLPYDTPPLTAWIDDDSTTQSDGPRKPLLHAMNGRVVRIVLSDAAGSEWGSTPYVTIPTWNIVDQLKLGGSVETGPVAMDVTTGSKPVDLPLSGVVSKVPYVLQGLELERDHSLQSVTVGTIRSGHTMLATLPLDLYYLPRSQFGMFPLTFGAVGTPVESWKNRGAVKIGDEIDFRVYLDNQGNTPRSATIWVKTTPKPGRRIVSVAARGAFLTPDPTVDTRTQPIGSATVTSAEDRPIALRVVPRSTRVKRFQGTSQCTRYGNPVARTIEERLPDGITSVGVDLASFGGITFHSDCVGTEFNQTLYFRVRVVEARR